MCKVGSCWDKEFLSYPFRKVCDTNMTFYLDLLTWISLGTNIASRAIYLPLLKLNRSSNLLGYLSHNARVYGYADIHTYRPTYRQNVQSNMPSFFKRVKLCFNVQASRSVYYRENRRSRLRTVGAAKYTVNSVVVCIKAIAVISKREVPRGVRNSKVRRQDKFRRDKYTFDSEVKYMIQTYYLFDICVVCIYLKGVSSLFVRFPEVLTKDIDCYKTNDKLNKTKLRFIKVTHSWSLLMTEMV